jgi:hypothetical protein
MMSSSEEHPFTTKAKGSRTAKHKKMSKQNEKPRPKRTRRGNNKRRKAPDKPVEEPFQQWPESIAPLVSETGDPSVHMDVEKDILDPAKKLSEVIQSASPDGEEEFYQELTRVFECIALGVAGFCTAETPASMALHVAQMCHSIYGKSVAFSFGEMMAAMSGDENQDDSPDWVTALRTMSRDWDTFQKSKLLKTGRQALIILCSLGFCRTEKLDFSIKGLQVFEKITEKECENMDWSNIFSVILSITELLCVHGYQAYKYGDWRAMIYDDDELLPILQEVTECEKFCEWFELGQLQALAFMDEQALSKKLENCVSKITELYKATNSPGGKRLLHDKLHKISMVHGKFVARLSQGGLRIAPFTVGLFGPSSVGKSPLATITIATCLRAMGVSAKDADIMCWNPRDKYMSTAHNAITGVIMNEMSQLKAQYVDIPDIAPYMQMADNVKFYANMAEVEKKGKVCPAPYCMVTTKNIKDNGATQFANEPLAVVRREHFIITVMVRPEFQHRGGMLDSKKMRAAFPDTLIPDVWELRVEVAVCKQQPNPLSGKNIMQAEFGYEVYEKNGMKYDCVNVQQYLDLMVDEAKEYLEAQRALVSNSSEVGSKLPFCDEHRVFAHKCGCKIVSQEKVPVAAIPEPEIKETHTPTPITTSLRKKASEFCAGLWEKIDEEDKETPEEKGSSWDSFIVAQAQRLQHYGIESSFAKGFNYSRHMKVTVETVQEEPDNEEEDSINPASDSEDEEEQEEISALSEPVMATNQCERCQPILMRSRSVNYRIPGWTFEQFYRKVEQELLDYALYEEEVEFMSQAHTLLVDLIPFPSLLRDLVVQGTQQADEALSGLTLSDQNATYVAYQIIAVLNGQNLGHALPATELQSFLQREPEWKTLWEILKTGSLVPLATSAVTRVFDRFSGFAAKRAEKDLNSLCTSMRRQGLFSWYNWLPEEFLSMPLVKDTIVSLHASNKFDRAMAWLPFLFGLYQSNKLFEVNLWLRLLVNGVLMKGIYDWGAKIGDEITYNRVLKEHRSPEQLARVIRDSVSSHVGKFVMVVGVVLTLKKAYDLFHSTKSEKTNKESDTKVKPVVKQPTAGMSVHSPNSTTKATNQAFVMKEPSDIQAKNNSGAILETIAEEQMWKLHCMDTTSSIKPKTITHQDLVSVVSRNVLYFRYLCPITNFWNGACITMIGHNLGITTLHSMPSTDTIVHFYKIGVSPGCSSSANFSCYVGPLNCEPIGKDLCLVVVDKGGTWRNLIEYLPDVPVYPKAGTVVYKKKLTDPPALSISDSTPQQFHSGVPDEYDSGEGPIQAIRYSTKDFTPYAGMCGAPLISNTKETLICGMHVAMATDPNFPDLKGCGYAQPITRQQVNQAISNLSMYWFIPLHSGEKIARRAYGQELIVSSEVHPKSPVLAVNQGHFEYIGQTGKRASFHSTVHLTPICRDVEEAFGVKCDFHAPRSKEEPFLKSLRQKANCSIGIPAEEFLWACSDYNEELDRLAVDFPQLIEECRVLTDDEALNGVDGVRFIDAMDLNTSPGLPLTGNKRDLILEVEHEGKTYRLLVSEVLTEMQYIEDCFAREERCYHIGKGCVKDEATEKEKMRIFVCGQFAFNLVCRKYLGWIVRVLQMSVDHSECCVGLNPHGPEWEEWCQWYQEYTTKYIFDGDQGQYDDRQSARINGGFGSACLNIAIMADFSAREKLMIRGCITEMMYPIISMNGDVVMFFGTTISGHIATVVSNSVGHSLIMRSAAKKLSPNITRFREVAKLGFYGDDLKGGVHPNHLWFNGANIKKTIEPWGYTFTPADKGDEFKWDPDGDFLKMVSHTVEGTDIRIGQLLFKSILKPLMAVTKSSLPPLTLAAENVNGSTRMMFAHGRVAYEGFQKKMIPICEKHGILGWCHELGVSYDAALDRWRKRYESDIDRLNKS